MTLIQHYFFLAFFPKSQFCKMTRANTRASNKQKLDMVLLCILSQFGLVKFGWELSGLVWFGMD